jgi:hypothetical protein
MDVYNAQLLHETVMMETTNQSEEKNWSSKHHEKGSKPQKFPHQNNRINP